MARYNVIIVGGGPVGVGLAVELGQRGVSCLVVERHLAASAGAEGSKPHNRTPGALLLLELRRRAAWGPSVAAWLPDWRRHHIQHDDERVLAATQADGARGSGVRDYYFQTNERLPQYLTETVLRERLKQMPNVTTLLGWVAEKVEQDENGTRVTIAPANEGATAFRAGPPTRSSRTAAMPCPSQRVVRSSKRTTWSAATAARSLVRETLGIERAGRDFHQRMVLAVLRSPDLHALTTRFPDATTFRIMNRPQGRLAVLRPHRRGRGLLFPRPGPCRHNRGQLTISSACCERSRASLDVEFDHIGFWDLRMAVADDTARAGFHRRRRCSPTPALWWLWPEHGPGRRDQPGLEAGGQPARLGRQGPSRFVRRRAAPDFRRYRRGRDCCRYRPGRRVPRALQPRCRPRGVQAELVAARPRPPRPLQPELPGLIGHHGAGWRHHRY